MTRVKTPGSGRQLNPQWMAAVRELTEAGCTKDGIARRLGIGTATVGRYRARLREQAARSPLPKTGD